jgi:hypothetical protein
MAKLYEFFGFFKPQVQNAKCRMGRALPCHAIRDLFKASGGFR